MCLYSYRALKDVGVHQAEYILSDLVIQAKQKVLLSNGIFVIWVHVQRGIVQIIDTYSDAF